MVNATPQSHNVMFDQTSTRALQLVVVSRTILPRRNRGFGGGIGFLEMEGDSSFSGELFLLLAIVGVFARLLWLVSVE